MSLCSVSKSNFAARKQIIFSTSLAPALGVVRSPPACCVHKSCGDDRPSREQPITPAPMRPLLVPNRMMFLSANKKRALGRRKEKSSPGARVLSAAVLPASLKTKEAYNQHLCRQAAGKREGVGERGWEHLCQSPRCILCASPGEDDACEIVSRVWCVYNRRACSDVCPR